MAGTPKDQAEGRGKPDLPESTLRIMDRMVKTPPQPKPQPKREADSGKPKGSRPPREGSRKKG